MKKRILISSVIGILIFALGWSVFAPQSLFASRGLEQAVREQIGKPVGAITPEDCKGVTELDLSLSDWNTNLKGLEYFVDLEKLNCSAGLISDISALSSLTKLQELKLYKNRIKDLTPLSGLINLENLDLYDNNVKDLSPLASLSNLKHLVIGKNPVERLENGFAPLAHLEGLGIGSYADYSIVVKDGAFVDRDMLPREEVVIDNPP